MQVIDLTQEDEDALDVTQERNYTCAQLESKGAAAPPASLSETPQSLGVFADLDENEDALLACAAIVP